mgnify:CR=1 FL=1
MKYTDVWNELTERIGYWVDMDNPYITYKSKYIETVWWLLKKLYDDGLIYKGYSIQPYSPKAGTGLSSHELNQPGTYQDVTDTTVTAQFECIEETLPERLKKYSQVYILAWTTTPWTLPSNTALTVGKKIKYVLIRTFNLYTHKSINVILAKDLIPKVFKGNFVEIENEDANKIKNHVLLNQDMLNRGYEKIYSIEADTIYAPTKEKSRFPNSSEAWQPPGNILKLEQGE